MAFFVDMHIMIFRSAYCTYVHYMLLFRMMIYVTSLQFMLDYFKLKFFPYHSYVVMYVHVVLYGVHTYSSFGSPMKSV